MHKNTSFSLPPWLCASPFLTEQHPNLSSFLHLSLKSCIFIARGPQRPSSLHLLFLEFTHIKLREVAYNCPRSNKTLIFWRLEHKSIAFPLPRMYASINLLYFLPWLLVFPPCMGLLCTKLLCATTVLLLLLLHNKVASPDICCFFFLGNDRFFFSRF